MRKWVSSLVGRALTEVFWSQNIRILAAVGGLSMQKRIKCTIVYALALLPYNLFSPDIGRLLIDKRRMKL